MASPNDNPGPVPLPFHAGDDLACGWRVMDVTTQPGALRFRTRAPGGRDVTFVVDRTSIAGRMPFDSVYYQPTDVPFDVLAPAGREIAERLRVAAGRGPVAALLPPRGPTHAPAPGGVVLRYTRDGLARAAELPAALAARAASPSGGDEPVIEIPSMADVEAAGDQPVPLERFRALVPEALLSWQGRPPRIDSRVGMPLCLFPELLIRIATGIEPPAPDRDPRDEAFASGCDACGARPHCRGVTPDYARRFGTDALRPWPAATTNPPAWQDLARWVLMDHPWISLTLGELLPAASIPEIACTRPWTSLAMHPDGTFGPCNGDYPVERHPAPDGVPLAGLFRGPVLASFRRALLTSGHPATCGVDCPVLRSGADRPANLRLVGGSGERVENQIRLVRALLDGTIEVHHDPVRVGVIPTRHCNYRCVMCRFADPHPLADELPAAFWDDLEPWLDTLVSLHVTGGEPLASPAFRAFIERQARTDRRPVLDLVTNGALLTPAWLDRLPRLPVRWLGISLNAATARTYRQVHRGIPWAAMRRNLDAVLRMRATGRFTGALTYSLVLLRCNLDEVVDFVDLALRDGADARYHVPIGNRNGQSILTDPDTLMRAVDGLREAARRLEQARRPVPVIEARDTLHFLEDRLARGVFEPSGGSEE